MKCLEGEGKGEEEREGEREGNEAQQRSACFPFSFAFFSRTDDGKLGTSRSLDAPSLSPLSLPISSMRQLSGSISNKIYPNNESTSVPPPPPTGFDFDSSPPFGVELPHVPAPSLFSHLGVEPNPNSFSLPLPPRLGLEDDEGEKEEEEEAGCRGRARAPVHCCSFASLEASRIRPKADGVGFVEEDEDEEEEGKCGSSDVKADEGEGGGGDEREESKTRSLLALRSSRTFRVRSIVARAAAAWDSNF